MRYLSVCSGIEAATVAWHPLGGRAGDAVDRAAHCCGQRNTRKGGGMTCHSCHWSAADAASVLFCQLRDEPCTQTCEEFTYAPGTDERELTDSGGAQ